jgi:murein DD-endopeptidase MepM/ murein hydrolase activator NlpD
VKPVAGKYELTAGFDQSGGMWAHKHSGQDFAVPTGTKVEAVHSGTVVTAGWGGAYGNNIVIKHANRTYSQYGHLSKIQVRVGEKVHKGERIALSGNTGNTTGPHLHFEIRKTPVYGSAVNPLKFLRAQGVMV